MAKREVSSGGGGGQLQNNGGRIGTLSGIGDEVS